MATAVTAPQATQPTTGLSIADKLTAMAEKSITKPGKPKVILEVTDDQDDVCFVIPKSKLLEGVGPSATGTQDGVVLAIEGQFPFTLPNGQVVNLTISMKGGWAQVKVARS